MINPRLCDKVARQVLLDQSVIWHVTVEGANQIVAIPPGIRNPRITLTAMALGIPQAVHPVTGPALAKARRSEQAINEMFVGPRRVVGDKSGAFLGRGGQPNEHIGQAPDQRAAVCSPHRLQTSALDPGLNKGIDRVYSALTGNHGRL